MTNYDNFTLTQLVDLGRSAEGYFEHKLGYDEVDFKRIWLNKHGAHRIEFTLHDDFQKDLPVEMTYKDGWSIMMDLNEDFWDKVTTWPTREQRELTILARKMATIDANIDDIKSHQVRAFVARLQPDIDDLRKRITHLTNVGDTVEIF